MPLIGSMVGKAGQAVGGMMGGGNPFGSFMSGLSSLGGMFGGGSLGSSSLLGRVGSALFGGSNKALENQAMAYRRAMEGMQPSFAQAQERINPYAQQGAAANPLIASLLGMSSDTGGGEGLARFREGLGYQDTLNQALGGISANAAARGLLGSSGTGRAFQSNAARLAQGTFGNYLDSLLGQQQMGMNAAGAMSDIDLARGQAMADALYKEHATRGQKKSSFLSKLFGG